MECGLLNPHPPTRSPVRPTSGLRTPPSARPPSPPVRLSSRPAVRAPSAPTAQSARPPDRLSACLRVLGPVRASLALSAPLPPVRVSAPCGPSARSLHCPHPFRPRPPDRLRPFRPVRSSVRPRRQRLSACPLVRSVHVWSATSARPIRPVRSARARQLPLYIPHPASPQIIQLLAVRVGPQVFVAPLRTAALRGAQGLWEVGVNCRGSPCNFCFRSQQHGEGDHLHLGRPGYSNS